MKLLSLNGGGTSGYMSVSILEKIERELGYPSHKLFDLVSGVSTGSIIAGAIGKGIPASEIKTLYKKLSLDLFSKKSWLPWKPWYSANKLLNLIKANIEYNIKDSKTRILIYATKINGDTLQPKFWKSWKEDTPISKLIVSSCSAPLFFKPSVLGNDVLIDGGFVANNPSMCCISEAVRLGANIDTLYNLNLSCGSGLGLDKAKKLDSILKWTPELANLVTLSIKTGEEAVEYQAHQLIDFRNHVVTPSSVYPMASLDFDDMDHTVDKMWAQHRDAIINQLQIT